MAFLIHSRLLEVFSEHTTTWVLQTTKSALDSNTQYQLSPLHQEEGVQRGSEKPLVLRKEPRPLLNNGAAVHKGSWGLGNIQEMLSQTHHMWKEFSPFSLVNRKLESARETSSQNRKVQPHPACWRTDLSTTADGGQDRKWDFRASWWCYVSPFTLQLT